MAESDWVDDTDEGEWVDDDAPAKETSPMVSAVRKFVQGGSAGFSDEAAGGVEAVGRALGFEGAGGPMKDISFSGDGPSLDWEVLKDAYRRARDKERASLKKDSEDNPGISAGAEIVGSVMSPVNKLAPGASMAKQGAILGAATGAGSSEADLLEGEFGQFLMDTGVGGGLGFGLGKGGDYVGEQGAKILNSVGNKSGILAKRLAAKAVGAERGSAKKLGVDKVEDIGEHALENLLSPMGSTDDMIAKNAAIEQKGGEMMGDVFKQIDDANASTFSPRQVAEKLDDELGDFYRSPINQGEANQLDNTIESIMMREGSATDAIPLAEAQKLKQELGKVANWKNNLNITDKEKMARDAYGIANRSIDEAAEEGAKATGSVGLVDDLRTGKKMVSDAKGAEKFLTNKKASESNNLMSLSDWGLTAAGGGAGLATGDPDTMLGTGAMLLTKKGLQKYGVQNAALLANKVSKRLLQSPKMAEVAKKNPKVFQAMVNQITSKMKPQEMLPKVAEGEDRSAMNFESSYGKDAILQKTQGSKYAQVMQNAAQSGDQSVAAAHFVLQQRDPDYRKLIGEGDRDEQR